MTQITVRNIPASVEAKLRSLAERSGQSLNQTVIQLLEKAMGGKPGPSPPTISGSQRPHLKMAAAW